MLFLLYWWIWWPKRQEDNDVKKYSSRNRSLLFEIKIKKKKSKFSYKIKYVLFNLVRVLTYLTVSMSMFFSFKKRKSQKLSFFSLYDDANTFTPYIHSYIIPSISYLWRIISLLNALKVFTRLRTLETIYSTEFLWTCKLSVFYF